MIHPILLTTQPPGPLNGMELVFALVLLAVLVLAGVFVHSVLAERRRMVARRQQHRATVLAMPARETRVAAERSAA